MTEDRQQILVEMFTNTLYPGILLKGDCYDENGIKYIDATKPLTQQEIDKIKLNGIKKLYYRTNRLFVKVENTTSTISDQSIGKAMSLLNDIELRLRQNSIKLPESELKSVVNGFITDIRDNPEAFLNLLNISSLDDYTYSHSINVSTMSIMIGIALNFDNQKTYSLGVAGLLLDIGKSMIPQEILMKTDKLTNDEKQMIRNHPIYGYNMLKNDPALNRDILDGVLMHHENYGGGGYPLGIKHEQLSYTPQILALTDTFDAATTQKVYSSSITFPEVISSIMQQSGSRFNPIYAKIFLSHMVRKISEKPLFPTDSYVLLNTQEIGYVVGHTSDPFTLKPIVNIIFNPNARDKILKYHLQINLEKDPNRSIVKRIDNLETVEKLIRMQCKGDLACIAEKQEGMRADG